MKADEIKLFGINTDNKLVCRGLGKDEEWMDIQPLEKKVIHITSVGGVLFLIDDGLWTGAPAPGRLLARFATLSPLTPGAIGHAHGVHGMASVRGNLYSLSTYLGERPAEFHDVGWKSIGGIPSKGKTVAMAAAGEYLIAALENENTLLKRKLTDGDWSRLGYSKNAVAIAAIGGEIYVVNRDNELWVRNANNDWKLLGDSIPIRTMTAALVVGFQAPGDSAKLQADADV